MKTRKSIGYAYPTSQTAVALGFTKTGCHYVDTSVSREDGLWSVSVPAHNSEGFASPVDPDLIAAYTEADGEPCPYFLKHGNPEILKAIGLARPFTLRLKTNN